MVSMKTLLYTFMALMATAFVACQNKAEKASEAPTEKPRGYELSLDNEKHLMNRANAFNFSLRNRDSLLAAVYMYDSVLRGNPANKAAWNGIVSAACKLTDYHMAIEALQQLERLEPIPGSTANAQGLYLAKMGQNVDARKQFKRGYQYYMTLAAQEATTEDPYDAATKAAFSLALMGRQAKAIKMMDSLMMVSGQEPYVVRLNAFIRGFKFENYLEQYCNPQ